MSWRKRNEVVRNDRAVALGGQRREWGRHAAWRTRGVSSTASPQRSGAQRRLTSQELSNAIRAHTENVERARQAAQREQERNQRQREDMRRKNEEREQRIGEERHRMADAARQMQVEMQAAGQKRSSMLTTSQSRTMQRSIAKRPRKDNDPLLVWNDACLQCARETLVERALHEGPVVVEQVDVQAVRMSMRDGTAILCGEDGRMLAGGETSAWRMASKWKGLVAGLVVKETIVNATSSKLKVEVEADGGNDCAYIGSGTFNVILTYPDKYKPTEHTGRTAWRVTRPDKDKGEYKYQNFNTCLGEMHNALFCSANGIGVPLQGICAFEACRPGRTLRYGTVMVMTRAACDLACRMKSLNTVEGGAGVAEKVIDLLYRASRMGILFVDIKPANLLIINSKGEDSFKLTDYDPAFFLTTDRDWRSLLLLNLALLSAHIHNADYGAPGRGWAKAVAPLLRQLVDSPSRYDSAWLFQTRAVNIEFAEPANKSDFELQKLVACMWTSYFIDRDVDGLRSRRHPWKHVTQNKLQLLKHWESAANCLSWPVEWSAQDSHPLIAQLVDFALQFA